MAAWGSGHPVSLLAAFMHEEQVISLLVGWVGACALNRTSQ